MDAIILEETMTEMRSWLADCYPDDEEEIAEASYQDLKKAIDKDYEGGFLAFLDATYDYYTSSN